MYRSSLLIIAIILAACGADSSGAPHGDGQEVGEDLQASDSDDEPEATPVVVPIDAPLESWTWVDFPHAVCGDGSATGIGVNPTDRSDDLFVYFMGGGACWDANSCIVLQSAVNIQRGYDSSIFAAESKLNAASFDRADPNNPFRDMSYVFVPYCTGDVHAGDKVTTYSVDGESRELHHRGAANVEEFLARLVPTFETSDRVFVGGSSAGGFGAQLNFHRFAAAFADAEVHVLSDSGPLVQPAGTLFSDWKGVWGVPLPPGCADCGDGFPQWFDHITSSNPASRFGLLSYDNDQVIRLYFGYPLGDSFRETMSGFVDDHIRPAQNAEAYIVEGSQHVMMITGLATPEDTDTNSLADWIRAWVEDDPAWTSLRP